jgi:3-deoxy-manno-octulosonate cytidylyltransferase (CMP-KDO synthetase)
LKPSQRELEHKLEQLRFLDNNYSIYVTQYDEIIPSGIDTQEDVESALLYIKKNDC